MSAAPLIEATGLSKHYRIGGGLLGRSGTLRAVDDVNLVIHKRETVGLVGESGSGKSTLGRLVMHLTPPTSGSVTFEGWRLGGLLKSEMRRVRRRMQIVFQDPYSSLHPRRTIRQTLAEATRVGGVQQAAEVAERIGQMAHAVGLGPAHLDSYPFALSGGQRQRVAIARALAVQPSFIVADEAVSALDVSIQAQILNLLADLQEQFDLTYLFVSHDLNVIRYLCTRVLVMYQGRVVEEAPTRVLFGAAAHPYTQLLLRSMPGAAGQAAPAVAGGVAMAGERGCRFVGRCPHAFARCGTETPPLIATGPEHKVACHLAEPWSP